MALILTPILTKPLEQGANPNPNFGYRLIMGYFGMTSVAPILYNPCTASANKNSSMRVMLRNISRAPVGVPGKADEIIRQASLCIFVSFLTRYFLLRSPAQDTHAYDMIGRIIAVYIHFIMDGFIPQVLITICQH